MTKTIASATDSSKHYFLTIDEQSHTVDCSCPDMTWRGYRDGQATGHTCKHMKAFNAEVQRAARFLALKNAIRGMEESARCYRELANSY